MTTADQLVAHAVGDYLIQSHWQASEKTKSHLPAIIHALTYTLPFLLLTHSPWALLVIAGTHYVIDHWRIARYVCWAKNLIGPQRYSWAACSATGYPPETPAWLSVWLMIIADNTMHILINGWAIAHL